MSVLAAALEAAADNLEANADELTRLDSMQGDGDLGRTAVRIAAALREAVQEIPDDAVGLLRGCGARIASAAPSSSGTLVASGFLAAAKALSDDSAQEGANERLNAGLAAAIAGIQHRGKAQPGDRTLIDALAPALDWLEANPGDSRGAAAAAVAGVEATRTMVAKFGRARFLASHAHGEPDPGAVMVGEALAAALRPADDHLKSIKK